MVMIMIMMMMAKMISESVDSARLLIIGAGPNKVINSEILPQLNGAKMFDSSNVQKS